MVPFLSLIPRVKTDDCCRLTDEQPSTSSSALTIKVLSSSISSSLWLQQWFLIIIKIMSIKSGVTLSSETL